MICINVMTSALRKILYQRRWYEINSAYFKTWRGENREKVNSAAAKWRRAHPEQAKANVAAWRAANPEKDAECSRRWLREHPGKKREKDHRRRARINGSGGTYTAEQFKALGNVCLCCRRTEPELAALGLMLVPDHIMPLSKGGSNNIDNIQPLCHGGQKGNKGGCNQRKGTKYIDYRGRALCASAQ
jgi:5-methylcytosine-specific restriction endonuclease McrA